MHSCSHKFVDSNVCLKCGVHVRELRGPRRIQRRRTKGWRMPEGAVYVGRPTRWGNPFFPVGDSRDWTRGERENSARLFRAYLLNNLREGGMLALSVRFLLRGKDLACWPLDQPCHADVLLEVARLELHHPDQCPNEGGCGWDPGQTFVCTECGREYCYCQGCSDDVPELCDYCAQIHHAKIIEGANQ